MAQFLPPVRVRTTGSPSRRSFLRYSGASAVVGTLWLASCKKDDPAVTPAAPSISSFSPANGMPGTTVTVTGTNFTGATAVLLATVASTTFTVVSATSLTFIVPAGATSGTITITTPGGTASSGTNFTVIAVASTAPTITSFSPTSALPGTSITATGTNLGGGTKVTVNGLATSSSTFGTTSLTFIIPTQTAAGLATIVLTSSGGTSTNNTGLTILPSTINVGTGDAGVLNYAYALEQLEAAFYTQVRTGSYYTSLGGSSAEKLILDDLYYHEVIHRDFLKAVLLAAGVTPLKDLTVDFTNIDFSSRNSVLSTARAFEDLGSAAYIGAGQYLTNATYLLLAGKIASVEARHAALIRDLITENTFVGSDILSTSSLEIAKRPAEVAPLVNTYLAIGSMLDVSGLV
jgi:hypothetical protein